MIVTYCLICNGEIKTYPSIIKMGRGKYCSRSCQFESQRGKSVSPTTQFKKGQKPHNFKGWRYSMSRKNGKAYILTYKPQHPYATKAGYVRKHRLIMEAQLNRYLLPHEIVDHIDGDTLNNDPSNLRVMTKIEHDRMNTPLNIHRRWVERANNKS